MLGLESKRYVGPRAYYIPALLMARLILVQAGMAFDDLRLVESEVLLTNMPILFERYVRSVLAETLSEHGYVVEKRTGDRAPELFLDGGCKLEPDILICSATSVELVADAKYKTEGTIDATDYYQLCAYLDRFNADKGLLILPGRDDSETLLVERRLYSGKRVYELGIPLKDWLAAEAGLKQNVLQLVAV
jgi:5-methylcytosine-specific restriction endonuclease McrBC regulatory subunit McrC